MKAIKIAALVLSIVTAVLLEGSAQQVKHVWRGERGLTWKMPGEPMELGNYIADHGKSNPDQVSLEDGLYNLMFPGTVLHTVNVNYSQPGEGDAGMSGVTTIRPMDNPNYRAIGNHSARIQSVSVRVFDPRDVDTAIHETAHAYNAQMRGNAGGYHFPDEGMAVMVNWIFHPSKEEDEALTMGRLAGSLKSPSELKDYILNLYSTIPEGHNYPVAGFFMMQVYDLCGSQTVKYMITADQRTDSPDHIYHEILRGAEIGPKHLDEDGFWKEVYVRLQEWVR